MVAVAKTLKPIGRYMLAATFGNVHGVYKPGNVKLTPTILRDGQAAVLKELGEDYRIHLVFHGGSGSALHEIHETLDYGVIKMNVDTDTQYAYTQLSIIYSQITSVLKVEEKWIQNDDMYLDEKAENQMKDRIIQSVKDLKANGTSLLKN